MRPVGANLPSSLWIDSEVGRDATRSCREANSALSASSCVVMCSFGALSGMGDGVDGGCGLCGVAIGGSLGDARRGYALDFRVSSGGFVDGCSSGGMMWIGSMQSVV